ncbi:MAG: hypothetical protein AB7H88_06440 [Vicinamibacterales bacterium]
MTSLVPPAAPRDRDIDSLRAQVAELEAGLDARRAEVARGRADLQAFGVRYRQHVGLLHEELDRIEAEIAELELGAITRRLEEAGREPGAPPPGPAPEAAPRFTTDAVRRLFRDVAKALHPDLAPDPLDRDRRHALMVAANRAYALGDEEQLRGILQAWERSPDAVRGDDPEAVRLRLERRAAQVEEELEALDRELAEMRDSPMWRLKAMVDEAAAKNKDLVKDMVRRLKRDIMAATNRRDAMRS